MKRLHPLKAWRIKRNISADELARLLGVGRSAVMRYESMSATQRKPEREILNKIAILTEGEVDGNTWWLNEEASEVVAKRHAAA